jgi:hypothetical protein
MSLLIDSFICNAGSFFVQKRNRLLLMVNMGTQGVVFVLQGRPAVAENQRHRAFYHTLLDSEAKLQFFAARQVACRILGSHGYLCHDCWLPLQDCMCAALPAGSSLWQGVQLWVYMHPKDFLRKNNTGKLLWQALGNGARLCICGIEQHEDVMWAAFQEAGLVLLLNCYRLVL